MTIKAEVMTITPAKAAKMLEMNRPGNRSVIQRRVAKYADEMIANRWGPTGQGISFSEDGFLEDGQHRLLAVVKSGVTVQMLVATGVSSDEFLHFDTGATRGPATMASIAGYKYGTAVASAARLLYLYRTQPDLVWAGSSIKLNPSIDVLLQELGRWPHIEEAALSATLMNKSARIPPAAGTAGLALLSRADGGHGYYEQFLDALQYGANLSRNDPRLTLRNWFGNQARATRGSGGGVHRQRALAILLKGWNAFLLDEKPSYFKWLTTESMPTIVRAVSVQKESEAA